MADKDDPSSATGEPGGSSDTGPGVTLRDAREARSISLEEISSELRIEIRLLQALEEGRYEELGAPVFAKGYIKQYSGRLGLDSAGLVEKYTVAVGGGEVTIAPSKVIKLRDQQKLTTWIIAGLALALIVVFLLVWWLNEPAVEVARPVVDGGPAGLPFAEVLASPGDAVPGVAALLQEGSLQVVDAEDSEPTSRELPERTGGESMAQVLAEPTTLTALALDPPLDAAAETHTVEPVESVVAPVAELFASPLDEAQLDGDGGLRIELRFTGDCWTDIKDAAGEQLLLGLAEAGDRRIITGPAPIDMLLGDAGAVEIMVDGQQFTVPAQGRRGNLARFTIDARVN
jgi:cytoskeleton protein RodZ